MESLAFSTPIRWRSVRDDGKFLQAHGGMSACAIVRRRPPGRLLEWLLAQAGDPNQARCAEGVNG
jgi:hypothetical protein